MARGVDIKIISRGILDVFDQWAKNDGEARINRVAEEARSSAPVVTGAYRDSIRVELVHTDRPVWRAISDSDHALPVESTTGNLARALDAAGGS